MQTETHATVASAAHTPSPNTTTKNVARPRLARAASIWLLCASIAATTIPDAPAADNETYVMYEFG